MAPAQRSLHITLVALTLFVSWLMTHTTFAFRYAHEFYEIESGGVGISGGLEFPGEKRPDYLDFLFMRPRAGAVLDAYPHNFVLIPPTAAARELMEQRPDWKVIYSDPSALLYARTGSAAARLKGIPVQGQAGPNFFP